MLGNHQKARVIFVFCARVPCDLESSSARRILNLSGTCGHIEPTLRRPTPKNTPLARATKRSWCLGRRDLGAKAFAKGHHFIGRLTFHRQLQGQALRPAKAWPKVETCPKDDSYTWIRRPEHGSSSWPKVYLMEELPCWMILQ